LVQLLFFQYVFSCKVHFDVAFDAERFAPKHSIEVILMVKFSVDYSDLQSKLSQKKAFRLSEVKGRIKKVAFDVVRFVDSDKIDDLWQIYRDGDDEYIVAMYEEQNEKKASASGNWKVLPDSSGSYIHLFCKNVPITRIALTPLGIPSEDAWLVSRTVMEKLANDQSYLNSLIQELTEEEKSSLREVEPSLLAGK